MAYSDWQDHDDHDDGGYSDHHDHTDSDCTYSDWIDHLDGGHSDHTDHGDGAAHTDWDNHSDHSDGAHDDWSDAHDDWTDGYADWDDVHSDWDDHSNDAYADWDDHGNAGHANWDDAYSDWDDHDNVGGDPHSDWTNHSDAGSPHLDWTDGGSHLNWSDAHTDWANSHDDWTDTHSDWTNHSDAGSPHLDWTDSHSDWQDHNDDEHEDYTVHADAGSPHIDWSDGGVHGDWTNSYSDWTDHDDYDDHDDGPPHVDWDDHANDTHTDWDDSHLDSAIPSGKTRVSGWIGGTDVSCYIIGADIWRDALNGIGRWELVLDNQAHWWGGAFAVDDDVTIHINGSLMMMGYVDDISPYIDSKGEYTEYIRVNGRDYGMDLAQLFITQDYSRDPATGVQWLADDIVEDAVVTQAGSEIVYTSPSVAGSVDYEFDRTYLADGLRDIAKMVDYDLYVQDNVPRFLHFFDIATMGGGAEHTAVNLTSVAGAATNNILRLEIGENIGFEVKNYIEAHAGELRDHYTDLNAADWITGVGTTTITDDTTLFVSGKGAIRMTAGAAATFLYMELVFPRYDHVSLDMNEPGKGYYSAYVHYTLPPADKALRLRLEDTNGDWIEHIHIAAAPFTSSPYWKATDSTYNDDWRYIDFDYGEGIDIKVAGTVALGAGYWRYIGASITFDWSQVATIRFTCEPTWLRNNGDFVVIDELKIPAIEVISIQQDAVSIAAYGTRMKEIYRPDIKSQVELDAFAVDQLPKYADPLQTVKITAIGQVDSNYAAQSLDVQAPSSGIGTLVADVPYRIFTLHHSVKLSPLNNEIVGYDYITEYELVKHQIGSPAADQVIEPTRAIRNWRPTEALMRNLREEQRYRGSGAVRR